MPTLNIERGMKVKHNDNETEMLIIADGGDTMLCEWPLEDGKYERCWFPTKELRITRLLLGVLT